MRFEDQAVFEARFQQENARLLIERTRFILGWALVLYLAFWFLDRLVADDLAFRFLVLRFGVALAYVLSLAAVHSRFAERLARPAVMVSAVSSALVIAVMSAALGGFASNYFVGIIIVIYVVGFFIPWGLADAAVFCLLSILIYLGVNLTVYGPSRLMIAPLFFLSGTAVFTYLATLSNRRTRRRDLSLRLQIERAHDGLKRLDEAKTSFFANVSHELRTPLTLLLGPLEELQAAEVDREKIAVYEAMGSNARRLLRQVNALLDVAKLEAGRLAVKLKEGDLGALLRDLVSASAPHARGRGIELVTVGLDALPRFPFDGDKVEMVAANLLSNAVKFTPSGGRVEVRASADADQIAFEVEDSGPGIPEDQLEAIFDRFHQVEAPATSQHGGTGLGLALARELTRLHGGNIQVRSRLGEGSTFRVELPRVPEGPFVERRRRPRRKEDQLALARTQALTAREFAARSGADVLLADMELPQLTETATPAPAAPAGAPRLLLVEDNADLRNFLAQRLAKRYEVETAGDGEEGLAAAVRRRPDLIVSDIMMPRMDGAELCRRLRADPALRTVPIILVTAKSGEEAIVEGLDLGADDYVTKPFALRELEARIGAQLRAKEIERQLHERESRLVAIGEMTGSVVHDLRNPLTLVKGHSELALALAEENGEPEAIARELTKLGRATERLRRMIEEIMEFARSGASELGLGRVSAAKFLDRVVGVAAADLERQGIEVELDLAIDPEVAVAVDRERMRRVIENLLANARDAVADAEGQRRIVVRARVADERLAIRVADSGPGIPDEMVERLFEAFATRGKKRGTGLGLATVRNLAKAHGGDVTFEQRSAEGGASFTIHLPIAPAEAVAD